MEIRGIVFDVGWTLYDETERLRRTCQWLSDMLWARFEMSVTPEKIYAEYRGCCEFPTEVNSLFLQTLLRLGVGMRESWRLRMESPWKTFPFGRYEGVGELLRKIAGTKLRMGVLANQPRDTREFLFREGVLGLFDDVWLSGEHGIKKPHTEFLKLPSWVWELDPREILFVGDRYDHDVQAPAHLGYQTLRVFQGPHAARKATGYRGPSVSEIRGVYDQCLV